MEKVILTPYKAVLELQIFDFSRFPEAMPNISGLLQKRFLAGESLKSGARRSKNAVTYKKEYVPELGYGECIKSFAKEICDAREFWQDAMSINYKNAFIRAHIPITGLHEAGDFNIDAETLKNLFSRKLSLDFWFIEGEHDLSALA